MKKIYLFILIIVLFLSQTASAQDSTLIEQLLEIREEYSLIGFSVAVVHNNDIVFSEAIGLQDIGRNIQMEEDSKYRIASISKTITATALMQLYEQNLVNIEADISNYLGYTVRNPYFPNQIITLKQLMTHTSSLRDGSGYYSFLSDSYGTDTPPAISEILLPNGDYYTSDMWSSAYPPGDSDGFSYCNLGSGILASVVELVSGQHFHQYCQEHIFDPLGMDACFNDLENISDINKVAVIYRWFDGVPVPQADNYLGEYPDPIDYDAIPLGHNGIIYSPQGGCRVSALDLSKFMIAHSNQGSYNGYSLLEPETVELMHDIHWSGWAMGGFYKMKGLHVHITEDLIVGEMLKGHAGEAYGLLSDMYFDEEYDYGIIFVMNGGIYDYGDLVFYDVEEDIYELLYESLIQNPSMIEKSSSQSSGKLTHSAYPNPFNPNVKIRFNLPEESHLKLNIYDISGKLIKTLIDNPVESGYYSAIWRGDDENGKIVNSGVYFYQIESGKFMETRKLILLR